MKVVIMTGAGDRAFCTGGDIQEEAEVGEVDNDRHIANFKKPTICALNGLAYDGGAYLAAAFDIRIGCPRSSFRFLTIEGKLESNTRTLPMIVGLPMAKELLFSGRVVKAEEAYRIGLLNHLVLPAEVLTTSIDLAKEISRNHQSAVYELKGIVNHKIGMDLN